MRISRTVLVPIVAAIALVLIAAYAEWFLFGLPHIPPYPAITVATARAPFGFPAWVCVAHYVNFLFLILLMRSGLQILMDHPRLYWNVHCTPGTEWIRFTPVVVPRDRLYTAKDD
ncbi:MAG: hypothetical protein ACHQ17_08520, partial [Polyangia bacterium]